MKYTLSAALTDVHDGSPPAFESLGVGDPTGGEEQTAQGLAVPGLEVVERDDVLPRDQENMRRGLRLDVTKRDDVFGFENDVGGNITRRDATEEAIRIGVHDVAGLEGDDRFSVPPARSVGKRSRRRSEPSPRPGGASRLAVHPHHVPIP